MMMSPQKWQTWLKSKIMAMIFSSISHSHGLDLLIQVPSTSPPSQPSPPSPPSPPSAHKDVPSPHKQQRPSVTPDEVRQFFLEYHHRKEKEEEEEGEEVSGVSEGTADSDAQQSSGEGELFPASCKILPLALLISSETLSLHHIVSNKHTTTPCSIIPTLSLPEAQAPPRAPSCRGRATALCPLPPLHFPLPPPHSAGHR